MFTRQQVVDYARSLIGTKYHLGAMLPGVALDCATYILVCYKEAGIITKETIGQFAGDWDLHTSEDLYKQRILRYAIKVAETTIALTSQHLPGNVILCKTRSHVYNHGAIITSWPMAVECVVPCVREVDLTRDQLWSGAQIVVGDPWLKADTK